MQMSVSSAEDYSRWTRDFNTFRYALQNAKRGGEVIRRFMRLTIEDVNRREVVTFAAVHRITGRTKAWLREEMRNWEAETGNKVETRLSWRDVSKKLSEVHGDDEFATLETGREVIFAELDIRRKLGVPFKAEEAAKAISCSVSTFSTHSRVYVLNLADELLKMQVKTGEDYRSWRRDFNTFQHSLRNTKERDLLLKRFFRYAIEDLIRNDVPVCYSELVRKTGSRTRLLQRAMKAWEEETGNKVEKQVQHKTITLPMVLSSVIPTLHQIPLTFLESPDMGRPFNAKQLRMIYYIPQPKLRNTALFVMTFADGNRANDITFFNSMARNIQELDLKDIDCIKPDEFYKKFHDGKILLKENLAQRGRFLQTYFRLLRRQSDYLRKLTEGQRETFSPFLLRGVTDDHFWRHSVIHSEVRSDQITRRKKETDVVHEKFYLFRDITERRLIQVTRMRAAYLSAIESHKNGNCKLPFAYSIEDESVLSNGSVKKVRQHFRLWNASTLRQAHRQVNDIFYDYASPYLTQIIECDELYFLSYEGGTCEHVPNVPEPYWFIELLRDRRAQHNTPTGKARSGEIYNKIMGKLPRRTDWNAAISWWHDRLNHDMGLIFIPQNALFGSSLIGQAAMQIMTKTGARMNEFLQIRLTADRLCKVSLPENREAIAFWAIPKGRKAEEPFYIDERCMKALHAWWAYQKEQGETFDEVLPTKLHEHKLKPALYLWQQGGRHFENGNINACIRFMLHGVMLQTVEGKLVSVSSHLLRHGFATELRSLGTPIDVIALLMKQRNIEVTEYYSKPTPAKLVELQRKIFESRLDLSRSHIRPAANIRRQIEQAKENIGALVPVIGGTCTVANECPAKFACVGCAGNAPDSAKRGQVIELKKAYGDIIKMAERQNLVAERRKAMEVISSCNDVLAEMDLLDEIDRAAEEAVELRREPGHE
jgi:hypothetical protein